MFKNMKLGVSFYAHFNHRPYFPAFGPSMDQKNSKYGHFSRNCTLKSNGLKSYNIFLIIFDYISLKGNNLHVL